MWWEANGWVGMVLKWEFSDEMSSMSLVHAEGSCESVENLKRWAVYDPANWVRCWGPEFPFTFLLLLKAFSKSVVRIGGDYRNVTRKVLSTPCVYRVKLSWWEM